MPTCFKKLKFFSQVFTDAGLYNSQLFCLHRFLFFLGEWGRGGKRELKFLLFGVVWPKELGVLGFCVKPFPDSIFTKRRDAKLNFNIGMF